MPPFTPIDAVLPPAKLVGWGAVVLTGLPLELPMGDEVGPEVRVPAAEVRSVIGIVVVVVDLVVEVVVVGAPADDIGCVAVPVAVLDVG